jgi:hypothetical protein
MNDARRRDALTVLYPTPPKPADTPAACFWLRSNDGRPQHHLIVYMLMTFYPSPRDGMSLHLLRLLPVSPFRDDVQLPTFFCILSFLHTIRTPTEKRRWHHGKCV